MTREEGESRACVLLCGGAGCWFVRPCVVGGRALGRRLEGAIRTGIGGLSWLEGRTVNDAGCARGLELCVFVCVCVCALSLIHI